jgi:hypothetical protein
MGDDLHLPGIGGIEQRSSECGHGKRKRAVHGGPEWRKIKSEKLTTETQRTQRKEEREKRSAWFGQIALESLSTFL